MILKPCPFCGGNNIVEEAIVDEAPEEFYVCWMWCEDCACEGPGADTTEQAAEKWNERKLDPR